MLLVHHPDISIDCLLPSNLSLWMRQILESGKSLYIFPCYDTNLSVLIKWQRSAQPWSRTLRSGRWNANLQFDGEVLELSSGLCEIGYRQTSLPMVWLAKISDSEPLSIPISCLLFIFSLAQCLALVGAFNKVQSLVASFSRHCEISRSPVDSSTAQSGLGWIHRSTIR